MNDWRLHLLTSIEYSIGPDMKPVLHLFSRMESGERCITNVYGFKPYFFVRSSDTERVFVTSLEKKPSLLKAFNDETRETLWKVYTDIPKKVGYTVKVLEEAGFLTWEGKVRFPVRFLIDSGIKAYFRKGWKRHNGEFVETLIPVEESDVKAEIESVRMFLDIETVQTFGIVAITVWDSKIKQFGLICQRVPKWALDHLTEYGWIRMCDTEKELLDWFLFYWRGVDPDWISHYYGDKFDIPRIIERMKWYGIDYKMLSPLNIVQTQANGTIKIHGRENVDLWRVYKFMILRELKSFRLEDVCIRENIQVPKIHIPNFLAAWVARPQLIIQRNFNDVKSIKMLDEKVDLIDFVDGIRRFAGIRVSDAFHRTKVIDALLLRKARERGVVLPSQPRIEPYKYPGAIVLEPKVGAYGNVVVADFTSMYPMFIVSMNLSPEAINKGEEGAIVIDHEEVAGRVTIQPGKGIITELAEELIILNLIEKKLFKKTKKKLHKLKSDVLKSIRNALYGALAYPKFRLIDRHIPAIITFMGRNLLRFTVEVVEREGGFVIYGDTDGVAFVSESLERSKQIVKSITDAAPEFMRRFKLPKSPYEIDIDAVYLAYYAVDQKNYAALEEDGNIIYKGLLCVRSSTSDYAEMMQKELLDIILSDTAAGEPIDRDELIEKARQLVKDVRMLSREEQIQLLGVPHKLGKRQYKTKVIQLKAAEYSNKYLKTTFGYMDKPKRIYIKAMPPDYPPTDVLAFDADTELPDGIIADVERCIKAELQGAIIQILSPLGIQWSDIEMKTLDKFFGDDID